MGDIQLTLSEAQALLKQHSGGTFEEIYGPFPLGDTKLWEIWVWVAKDEEYAVRYVARTGGAVQYLDGFTELCAYLSIVNANASAVVQASLTQLQAENLDLKRQLAEATSERSAKLIRLLVAAFAFVAAVTAVIYLAARSNEVNHLVITLIGGVMASGAYLFFGVWKWPWAAKAAPVPSSAKKVPR